MSGVHMSISWQVVTDRVEYATNHSNQMVENNFTYIRGARIEEVFDLEASYGCRRVRV